MKAKCANCGLVGTVRDEETYKGNMVPHGAYYGKEGNEHTRYVHDNDATCIDEHMEYQTQLEAQIAKLERAIKMTVKQGSLTTHAQIRPSDIEKLPEYSFDLDNGTIITLSY